MARVAGSTGVDGSDFVTTRQKSGSSRQVGDGIAIAARSELERQLHSHDERIAHARLAARVDDVLDVRLDGEPRGDHERVRPFQRQLIGLSR